MLRDAIHAAIAATRSASDELAFTTHMNMPLDAEGLSFGLASPATGT
jgi:hypothetical protein